MNLGIKFNHSYSSFIILHLLSWWAQVDLNHRPLPYQGSALTN